MWNYKWLVTAALLEFNNFSRKKCTLDFLDELKEGVGV